MPTEINDSDDELIDPPTVEIIADNTAEEKTAVITKIAANGTVNFFLNGKRVDEQTTIKNSKVYYEASTGKYACKTFASLITAYKWIRRMSKQNRNYADGSCQIQRLITEKNGLYYYTILKMAGSKNVIKDAELQDFIDVFDTKEHIETMYRYAQRSLQHYQNYYGLTEAQTQEIYIAIHATDETDMNVVCAIIEF